MIFLVFEQWINSRLQIYSTKAELYHVRGFKNIPLK